jgi:2-enoate reductase
MKHDYQKQLSQLVRGYDTWFESPARLADGAMTADLYPYEALFSPITVNRVKIKNRIVMGPMANINMCDAAGRPGEQMIAYFAERARGGVGLITTGAVPVSFGIDPTIDEKNGTSILPRIDGHRTSFAGWIDLSERVHAFGAKIFIQLTPGAGRVGPPECVMKKHRLPVSASWHPNFYLPAVPCRRLSDRDCKKIIRRAGQASIDARELLFDGVYLHGHEGYLLEQMTNTAFNHRKIGRFSDWQAFGIDMVKEIRRRCGTDYPVMYRIDLSLALAETYGDAMKDIRALKNFTGERTIDMTLAYMKNLVAAGVDMFDIDLGCYDNWWLPHPPAAMPPGCFLSMAQIAREHFSEHRVMSNAGLPVPIVGVGKLGYPDLAERALRDGMCDMVMLARPLLADPDWPNKAYAGRIDEIMPCIGDQEGCIHEMFHGGHIQCAVNPRTGNEHRLGDGPLPAAGERKKIAVVGAGPAGVTCACTAARRGHEVTLFEAGVSAGGALIPGSVPLMKFDVKNYVRYLDAELKRTGKNHALKLKFKTRATARSLKKGGFDAIVACSGARYRVPKADGMDSPRVVKVIDLLLTPSLMDRARDIVIIGGGDVGCEAAHFCAYEHGKNVTLIEMLPYFMKNSAHANRAQLIYSLAKKGVSLLNCARAVRVTDDAVVIMRNMSPTVPDPHVTWAPVLPDNIHNPLQKKIKADEREMTVPADLVIIATGAAPDDELYEQCVREHAAPEIHNIGDSFKSGRVFEAVKAGFALGRRL